MQVTRDARLVQAQLLSGMLHPRRILGGLPLFHAIARLCRAWLPGPAAL